MHKSKAIGLMFYYKQYQILQGLYGNWVQVTPTLLCVVCVFVPRAGLACQTLGPSWLFALEYIEIEYMKTYRQMSFAEGLLKMCELYKVSRVKNIRYKWS